VFASRSVPRAMQSHLIRTGLSEFVISATGVMVLLWFPKFDE
jgi:hypothetical protein